MSADSVWSACSVEHKLALSDEKQRVEERNRTRRMLETRSKR